MILDQNSNKSDVHMNGDGDLEHSVQNEATTASAAVRLRRKRIRKQTVAKYRHTLNAKLETIVPPDPLFSKLHCIPGDMNDPRRLLSNILCTESSKMKLTLDDPFWDKGDDVECTNIKYSENNEYDYDANDIICLRLPINIEGGQKLRQQLSGYLIANTPTDDSDNEHEHE